VKVVFLDIDGVLNTHKSALLYGNLFIETPGVAKKLDPYGSLFIKRLTQHGVKIVLSSTWRMGERFKRLAPQAFDFDILDRTAIYPFAKAIRGDEVQLWLDQHPEVTHYCIVDDDSDMLAEQLPHLCLQSSCPTLSTLTEMKGSRLPTWRRSVPFWGLMCGIWQPTGKNRSFLLTSLRTPQ
jgi:hypothetical protein